MPQPWTWDGGSSERSDMLRVQAPESHSAPYFVVSERVVAQSRQQAFFGQQSGLRRITHVARTPAPRVGTRVLVYPFISDHFKSESQANLIRQAAGERVAQAVSGHFTLEMTRHYSDVDTEERVMVSGGTPTDHARGGAIGTTGHRVPKKPMGELPTFGTQIGTKTPGPQARNPRRG